MIVAGLAVLLVAAVIIGAWVWARLCATTRTGLPARGGMIY